MKTKPKIDIKTLRIEAREDDLCSYPKSYLSYIYTLRDDKRVFAHGDSDNCQKFLRRMFGFKLPDNIIYSLGAFPRYLEKDLLNFYTSSYERFDTFSPCLVGWELAGISQ